MESLLENLTLQLLSGESAQIPVTLSPHRCARLFLDPHCTELERYAYAEGEERMDYQLMKRFIFTAHNNLVEMDLSIQQSRVIQPLEELTRLKKWYEELERFLEKPVEVIAEALFFQKQEGFGGVRKDMEARIELVKSHKNRAEISKRQLTLLKNQLQELPKGSKAYQEKLEKYKRGNGEYVDRIHEISKLKTEIEKLYGAIETFKKEQTTAFVSLFLEEARQAKGRMLETLDKLAYRFDTVLWEVARESPVIRRFFSDAKIEGSFSSKTYLRYFINQLDEDNLSDELQRLKELSEYLEKVNTKSVFVLVADSEEAMEIKAQVERVDKDFRVTAAAGVDRIEIELRQGRRIDLLIVDYDLRYRNGLDLVRELWKRFPEMKKRTATMLRFLRPTYEQVNEAGRAGVHFMSWIGKDRTTLAEKVRMVL